MGRKCKKSKKKCGGTLPFMALVRKVGLFLKKSKKGSGLEIGDLKTNSLKALKVARRLIKKAGGKKNVKIPRIIPLPKSGGFLPLLPLIFGGLAAAGSIAGGGAAVAKAVNDAKNKSKLLNETQRHNQMMEAIALGKKGSGLYLKSFRNGYGLYFKKQQSKN